jgi:hypothetical protein
LAKKAKKRVFQSKKVNGQDNPPAATKKMRGFQG